MNKVYNKEEAIKLLQGIYGPYIEKDKVAEIINKSTQTEFSTRYLQSIGKIIESRIEKTQDGKLKRKPLVYDDSKRINPRRNHMNISDLVEMKRKETIRGKRLEDLARIKGQINKKDDSAEQR